MRVLLVYPEYPPLTYWGFSRALRYAGRRANMPPLGLITVAAMLPDEWDVKLVDMNVEPLDDADIAWADVVMTSTMVVQEPSLRQVLRRCRRLGVPAIAGGPHPSGSPRQLEDEACVVAGEAELMVPVIVEDLQAGRLRPRYDAEAPQDLDVSPIPHFEMLDLEAYASMAVQHSRGCPFACEFCDIWKLYGRKPRVKSPERLATELDALRDAGWRGSVFFVDDNFIGNRKLARQSLEALEVWQQNNGYPFNFFTEASVNLGSDDELMAGMRDAGFSFVFLGIESPSPESLMGANKPVNAKLDLLQTVERIQRHGIEVSSGFIVGFDEDTSDIFDRQIEFIERAGIPMAMVGLLTALEGTDLYDRLDGEGRLLSETGGNNTHQFEANFVTTMPAEELTAGYQRVMRTLYDPTLARFFKRCRTLLGRLGPNAHFTRRVQRNDIKTFLRTLVTIPTRRYGPRYLGFLLWTLRHHRDKFPEAVRLAIMGFHLEAITRESLAGHAVQTHSRSLGERLAHLAEEAGRRGAHDAARVRATLRERARALRALRRRVHALAPEIRDGGVKAYEELVTSIDGLFREHVPSAAGAFETGSRRLSEVRVACRAEAERLQRRGERLRRRAGQGLTDLEGELRRMRREHRDALTRLRREVSRLPQDYRLLGREELATLERRLEEHWPVEVVWQGSQEARARA